MWSRRIQADSANAEVPDKETFQELTRVVLADAGRRRPEVSVNLVDYAW